MNLLKEKHFLIFLCCLIVLAALSLLIFDHTVIDGDAISYIDAMNFLSGSPLPSDPVGEGFALHRVLTTLLGVEAVSLLSVLLGRVTTAWLFWDTFMYFIVNIVFYRLLTLVFKSSMTALLGGIFFAANYAMVTAGLSYFMDIGGWTFYVVSVYFLYKYMGSGQRRDLWLSALAISAGAFFKENALVAYLPFCSVLLYESLPSLWGFIKKIIPYSLVIFLPIAIHHVVMYLSFDHGYLYWVSLNREAYRYPSKIVEYIKSLGSLLNLLIPTAIIGAIMFVRHSLPSIWNDREGSGKNAVFILAVLASSIPAIMWPGITQRVLFMIVPGMVILASFFIKRYEKYWYLFVPALALYVLSSYFMDGFILKALDLPF